MSGDRPLGHYPIFIQNLFTLRDLFPQVDTFHLQNLLLRFEPTDPKCLNLVMDELAANPLVTENRPTTSRESNLNDDFEQIKLIVYDCEHNYIRDQLKLHENNPKRVQLIFNEMLEKKSYPHMRDFLLKQKREQELDRHFNMNLDLEEFLKIYPNPHEYFYKRERSVSDNYKHHCKTLLANNFKLIDLESIEKCLFENNWILTLSFKELEDAYKNKEENLKARIKNHLEKYAGHVAMHRKLPQRKHEKL